MGLGRSLRPPTPLYCHNWVRSLTIAFTKKLWQTNFSSVESCVLQILLGGSCCDCAVGWSYCWSSCGRISCWQVFMLPKHRTNCGKKRQHFKLQMQGNVLCVFHCRFGRKPSSIVGYVMMMILGVVSVFSQDYYLFLFLRCAMAFFMTFRDVGVWIASKTQRKTLFWDRWPTFVGNCAETV